MNTDDIDGLIAQVLGKVFISFYYMEKSWLT